MSSKITRAFPKIIPFVPNVQETCDDFLKAMFFHNGWKARRSMNPKKIPNDFNLSAGKGNFQLFVSSFPRKKAILQMIFEISMRNQESSGLHTKAWVLYLPHIYAQTF